jgi:hypothetical protein
MGIFNKVFGQNQKEELNKLIKSYPNEIDWKDILDFNSFDERQSAVDCLITNAIGMCENYVEFIPDNSPPLKKEILCWIWAIRPDLSKELIKLDEIDKEFKLLLTCYIDNNMEKFWKYISQ